MHAKSHDSDFVSDVKQGDIVGCDDYFVHDAEDHCIPPVFLTCITCLAPILPCIGWLEIPCPYYDLQFYRQMGPQKNEVQQQCHYELISDCKRNRTL